MDYKIESMGSLCHLELDCHINGVEIDESDFGENHDERPEYAADYGCGDMQFTISDPTEKVLEKYKITVHEYYDIANTIREELSFGSCGWCI
jgi:hypothetical protein